MSDLPPSLSPRPAEGDRKGGGGSPEPPTPEPTPRPSSARPSVQRSDVGLTAPGVFVVVLAVSLVGLLIDAFTVDSGWIFGVAFVLSCVYAALQVRRRDLLWAIIAPPLVFLALTVGRELVDPGTRGGTSDRALDVVSQLADHAPPLWVGTGLAAVIVLVRWRGWLGRR